MDCWGTYQIGYDQKTANIKISLERNFWRKIVQFKINNVINNFTTKVNNPKTWIRLIKIPPRLKTLQFIKEIINSSVQRKRIKIALSPWTKATKFIIHIKILPLEHIIPNTIATTNRRSDWK
jgi:hypothetical protein